MSDLQEINSELQEKSQNCEILTQNSEKSELLEINLNCEK